MGRLEYDACVKAALVLGGLSGKVKRVQLCEEASSVVLFPPGFYFIPQAGAGITAVSMTKLSDLT